MKIITMAAVIVISIWGIACNEAAKDIQKQLCEKNPEPKGCKVELRGDDKAAAPQGSCGS